MQTKARTFLFLFTSIFSLYILNSCASSPKNEENLTQAEQSSDKKTEEIPENQLENKEISQDSLANEENLEKSLETEENLQNSENTQSKPENDENQLSEKIDEDELLADSENATEETQEDFVEPEVKDSPFEEETKTAADEQNPESSTDEQNKAQDIPEKNEEEPELLPKTEENSGEEKPQTDENLELNENSMENQENLPQNGQKPEGKDELSEEIEEEEPKENEEQTENNSQKTPSRSMTAKNNQYVDIIYPGRGWIYMGEDEGKDQILRYFGRKLGTENTTFTLRTTKSGETVLHFYKNDVLKGEYIDDYLEIKVLEESAKPNERAKAPSYEESVPQKPVRLEKKAETQEETQKTDEIKNIEEKTSDNEQKLSSQDETNLKQNDVSNEVSNNVSKPEQKKSLKIDTKNLLEQAKKDFEAKSYAQALSEVQQYLDTQNTRIDEALFLQGQILEADSEVKNIKSAIDSYNSLIKNYPASTLWQEANRRKIYLNRYYVNIY